MAAALAVLISIAVWCVVSRQKSRLQRESASEVIEGVQVSIQDLTRIGDKVRLKYQCRFSDETVHLQFVINHAIPPDSPWNVIFWDVNKCQVPMEGLGLPIPVSEVCIVESGILDRVPILGKLSPGLRRPPSVRVEGVVEFQLPRAARQVGLEYGPCSTRPVPLPE
jgi:hypothetical protein